MRSAKVYPSDVGWLPLRHRRLRHDHRRLRHCDVRLPWRRSNTVTFTRDIAAGLPAVIDDEATRCLHGAGLASEVTATATYYYLAEGLGSTMVTVDSDGDVVNSYTYDVFGETRSESGDLATIWKE